MGEEHALESLLDTEGRVKDELEDEGRGEPEVRHLGPAQSVNVQAAKVARNCPLGNDFVILVVRDIIVAGHGLRISSLEMQD
jgi:hypothetical protein